MDNDQTVFQSPNVASISNAQDLNAPLSSFAPPPVVSSNPPLQEPVPAIPEEPLPEAPMFQEESLPEAPMFQEEPSVVETPNQDFQNVQQQEPIVPPPPPLPLDGATQPSSENDYSSGNGFTIVKKIAKIIIGFFVVLFVLMFLFTVIVPMLTNSSKKITLTYWGLWEDSSTMQGIISDFERKNPNILIDYSDQDIKQYRERLTTRIGNGNGPDIFRFHNSWYPMLAGDLLALPSDTISKADFNQSFYPVAQKDLTRNGAIYGIPLEIDTLSLFINNQLFQSAGLQPPTNWDDLVNDARVMTVKDKDGKIKTAGVALGAYSNVSHAPDIISLLFAQNGVDLNNLQTGADRAAGAFTFYTSFVTDQNNVWDNTLDPSILVFSRGDLAMCFGYSWDSFAIKQANPNLSFQVVPVPQLLSPHVTMVSYWAEGASSRTKHPKEALLFMKYLASKDTEEKLYADEAKARGLGEPYARTDLADTLKTNTLIYPFVSQAPDATSSFLVDGTYDAGLNEGSNTYLENAINSILNGNSPQSAFATFSQGVSQVLQKYGQ